MLTAALVMVSWLGMKEITQRFSSMKAMEVSSGKRASMRRDTWRIFVEHPWMGTGLATLQVVFPPYETLYDGRIVNHAHNDYVEALAEAGIAGGLCCALYLGLLLFHSSQQFSGDNASFAAVLNLSGLVACSGFLIHSLVDFNLRLPANAQLFFLMATLATSTIIPVHAAATASTRGRQHSRKR